MVRDMTGYAGENYRFYCQSAEKMPQCADGSIALTVTSPPYWNSIDYDIHSRQGNEEWYRERNYEAFGETFGDFLDNIERIFSRGVSRHACRWLLRDCGRDDIAQAQTLSGADDGYGTHARYWLGISSGHHLEQGYRWSKAGRLIHPAPTGRVFLPQYHDGIHSCFSQAR